MNYNWFQIYAAFQLFKYTQLATTTLRGGVLSEKRVAGGGGGSSGSAGGGANGTPSHKPTLVLWHRAVRDRLVSFCSERYRDHAVAAVHDDSINRMVRWMKALRRDLLSLGLGPFGGWQQLTVGVGVSKLNSFV